MKPARGYLAAAACTGAKLLGGYLPETTPGKNLFYPPGI